VGGALDAADDRVAVTIPLVEQPREFGEKGFGPVRSRQQLSYGHRRQALAICRYGSPFVITAQAIRAILLASATATFSRAQRARRFWIHGFALARLPAQQHCLRPADEQAPNVLVILTADP
jgi:hypothetical protein